jgi:hypothetical protein
VRAASEAGPKEKPRAECKHPLTEIDNYGRWLRSCMACNAEGAKVRLPKDDIQALRQLKRDSSTAPTEADAPGWMNNDPSR